MYHVITHERSTVLGDEKLDEDICNEIIEHYSLNMMILIFTL